MVIHVTQYGFLGKDVVIWNDNQAIIHKMISPQGKPIDQPRNYQTRIEVMQIESYTFWVTSQCGLVDWKHEKMEPQKENWFINIP